MLARRIIPTILYRGAETFKGEAFQSWRRIGNLRQAVRLYQARGVDELVLLDISGKSPDLKLVRDLCSECFMPVTVGGGIRTLEQIVALIANGADKIALNTAAFETPDLIDRAAHKVGSQSVVVSMDVKDGTVWTHSGTVDTGLEPVASARSLAAAGAGEIFLASVSRDGTLSGYDLELVHAVADSVSIPVIASGGAGTYEHLRLALEAGAHAVAASAMWAFTDATPHGAAEYLDRHGVPVRLRRAA